MGSTRPASDGCPDHADNCWFGRTHFWCIGYFDRESVWHTAMICATCLGVCIAELDDAGRICECGTSNPHVRGTAPVVLRR